MPRRASQRRRRNGRSAAKHLDLLVRRHDAARRRGRGARLSRRRGRDRAPALPGRARKVSRRGGRRRAADRGLHPGGAAVFGSGRGGADVTYANIRETAGWSKDAHAAGPKMAALLAAAAEPAPEIPFVSLEQRRRGPDLRPRRAGDRGRQPAQGPSRRDGADQAARRRGAAAGDRFPGGEGRDPLGQGSSRRVRAHRR